MSRFAALVLLGGVLWLTATRASAQDCTCFETDSEKPFSEFPIQADLFSPDTVEEVADLDVGEHAAPHRGVLWCANSDDPRCSQRDSDTSRATQLMTSDSSGAAVVDTLRIPRAATSVVRFSVGDELLESHLGSRLERPPRA